MADLICTYLLLVFSGNVVARAIVYIFRFLVDPPRPMKTETLPSEDYRGTETTLVPDTDAVPVMTLSRRLFELSVYALANGVLGTVYLDTWMHVLLFSLGSTLVAFFMWLMGEEDWKGFHRYRAYIGV